MKLSLIMVTYNRWDLTRDCLESLWPTLPPGDFELLVVDNASYDETPVELRRLGNRIRFLPQTENLGFSAANNLAATEARGDYLVFVNNDMVFLPDWWQPMRAVFDSHPLPGVVGNVQWSPRTRFYDHMGIVFSPEGQPLHFGKHFLSRFFRGVSEWGAVTAACCMVGRQTFQEAEGFDTAFRNGGEDVDFCLRLGEKGLRHYIANESIVHHLVSSSPGRHDFNTNNGRLFDARWAEKMKKTWGAWDERIYGINYLLRFALRPWRYNFRKLCGAARSSISPGPAARSLHAIGNPLSRPSRLR